MDPDKIKAALEAIKMGDSEAALALLEEMIAAAAGAADDSAPAPAELADDAPPAEETTAAEPPPEDDAVQAAAALTALRDLTGCASVTEATTRLRGVFERVERLDAERQALELSDRRMLVAELVQLGIEFPATAWEGKPENRTPVKRLADEPIAELRARVKMHRDRAPAQLRTPAREDSGKVVELSAYERTECKRRGMSEAEFIERKQNAARRV